MLSKPQLLLGMIACLASVPGLAHGQESDVEKKPPVETIRRAEPGNTITFDRETYQLKQGPAAPGTPTREVLEYLRPDETQEDFRKMVSLRMQPALNTNAMTVAQAALGQLLKSHPGSYMKEIEMSPQAATIMLVLVKKSDVEFNLWHYRKTPEGLPSVHFVLRNKRPYDTRKKFKAEQKKNLDDWVRDIKALGEQAGAYLAAATPGVMVTEEIRRASR